MKLSHLQTGSVAMLLAISLAGCSATTDTMNTTSMTSTDAERLAANAPPPPDVAFEQEPQLVIIPDSQVMIFDGSDPGYDLFRFGSTFYIQRDGNWYQSPSYRGPYVWLNTQRVPTALLEVPANRWRHHPVTGSSQ